ncbi:MAG: diguanylate cyclase, partial [Undibacterium sp.]|nr:diguanylate cyclase [Undibacterium sp.]
YAGIGSLIGNARTVFRSEQGEGDIPKLSYEQNSLTFEFSASFFEKYGSTQFQYFLEGFDKRWSDWSITSAKEYTNIPEGKYQFKVRAKNIFGTVGREAVYTLRILPPWYRTIWAYILWALLTFVVIAGIIRLYTLKLRREKRHLEKLVDERTQQLRNATLTDPLTGLRNRRFITEVLQNDISAFVGYRNYLADSVNMRNSTTGKEVFGLFLLDMDHFKHVNDTYGHDAGDQILKQFSTILTSLVRQDDVVIRLGGEEFLVVLKKTMPEYLHVFATKLLEVVASTPFDCGTGEFINKTCSIGYTSFPICSGNPSLLTFEQSVMVVDLAMYYAKNHGRNQAIFLEEGSHTPDTEESVRKTVTSLDYALKNNYLKIGKTQRPSGAT